MKRNPKFSEKEEELLLEWYKTAKSLIDAPLSLFNKVEKENAWASITAKVNALGVAKRDAKEIRKRLHNAKLTIKKKVSLSRQEGRKTGGGSNTIHLTNKENIMADILISDPSIHGIIGGMESARNADTGWPPVSELSEACIPAVCSTPIRSLQSKTATAIDTRINARKFVSRHRESITGYDTPETAPFSTAQLQRIVLLEQLKYIRAKSDKLDDGKSDKSSDNFSYVDYLQDA
jgi:hypothetical protein